MNKSFALRINKYFYYGWVILFVSAIGYFFSSAGQTYSISVFIDSYITDFGFTRTTISSVYSIATVISGLSMILVGNTVDRFGARTMLILVGVLLSLAAFFNSMITSIPTLFIGFFLLRLLGQGSMTLIPGALVPQWFEKKRALSFSLLSLGTILGNLIVPSINHYLINQLGWRSTWHIWGIAILVFFIPIAYVFIFNKPEDLELLPDNVRAVDHTDVMENIKTIERESFNLAQAVRTKEFWFIGIISMLFPMLSTGMMFHFFSIMSTKGIDDASTSLIMGLIAIPGFFIPFIAGTVIDRFNPKFILVYALLLVVFDLLFMNIVSSAILAAIFILIYGFSNSITSVTLNVIWTNFFGRLHLGSIRGAATIFSVVGSALGTLPFGLSFDMTGRYDFVFNAMAIVTLLSVVMSLYIVKPQKKIKT